MASSIDIRSVTIEDVNSIIELSKELGNSIDQKIVKNQLAIILEDNNHFAFVAEKNGKIVGYIHAFQSIRLTSIPFIEIGGLVVRKDERSHGIGKTLVKHLEKTNMSIRVRCITLRQPAHKFYQSLGYILKKEQKIFEKT